MQEMHLSLFTGDRLLSFYFWGQCGRCDRRSLYNRSGIYRTSHVVIRPIICITFKYTCFHIAARRFYRFSYTKDHYLGPVRCFVTPPYCGTGQFHCVRCVT